MFCECNPLKYRYYKVVGCGQSVGSLRKSSESDTTERFSLSLWINFHVLDSKCLWRINTGYQQTLLPTVLESAIKVLDV